jgi:hypothetical protein
MQKIFQTKNKLLLLLLLTVIQCKQRYTPVIMMTIKYIIALQRYRSGFKIIFSISKASKFSITQD